MRARGHEVGGARNAETPDSVAPLRPPARSRSPHAHKRRHAGSFVRFRINAPRPGLPATNSMGELGGQPPGNSCLVPRLPVLRSASERNMERAFRWCGVRARETILAAADESLPMWSRGRATTHEKVNKLENAQVRARISYKIRGSSEGTPRSPPLSTRRPAATQRSWSGSCPTSAPAARACW